MALINTTTTGVLGSTFYGDGTGDLTIQQNGVTVNKITNQPAFSAYPNAEQTLSSNTLTKILFQTEEFDTNNNFASSRFTPTVAGYYQVQGHIQPRESYSAGIVAIYKNGSLYKYGSYNANATGVAVPSMSCLVYCNGSTDYIEFYATVQSGQAMESNSAFTWFQGCMLRSA